MKKFCISFCVAIAALSMSCGSGTDDTEMDSSATSMQTPALESSDMMAADTSDGHAFMMEAASGGLMEVELGKYAAENASSAEVKAFGRMMVDDHSKANEDLQALAARKNVVLPTTPMEKHQEMINMLEQKKGAEFDRAYVDHMVKVHGEDIQKFTAKATEGSDADVVTFAAKTLPVLKTHHEKITKINEGMKK